MKGLSGKNVLVTGSSTGIGRAIALRMAQEGANVVINYRSSEDEAQETQRAVEDLNHQVKSLVVQADVSKPSDIDRLFDTMFDALGGIDILVNNAGFQISGAAHELETEQFTRIIDTNVTGAFLCARRALQHFVEHEKPGVLLNVSSVHEVIPRPQYVGYSVSKGGMGNLTRTLALEYADRGIRVNGIGPGATATPINEAWTDDPDKREQVASHIPMRRVGYPEEMAAAAAFLCSDEAAYITGQTLYIDGGLTLYPNFQQPWSAE